MRGDGSKCGLVDGTSTVALGHRIGSVRRNAVVLLAHGLEPTHRAAALLAVCAALNLPAESPDLRRALGSA